MTRRPPRTTKTHRRRRLSLRCPPGPSRRTAPQRCEQGPTLGESVATCGYMAGLSPVHGRHIDRLCRIQSVTGTLGTPVARHRRSRSAAMSVFYCPSGSDRYSANASTAASMRWGWYRYRSGSPPRPQVRTRLARRPARAGRRRTRPAGRDVRHISQTSSPGARIVGQNGRRSAKRAVIRTARSARTLSAICPQPLLCIDPR